MKLSCCSSIDNGARLLKARFHVKIDRLMLAVHCVSVVAWLCKVILEGVCSSCEGDNNDIITAR